jgi:hypothetical protein
MTIAQRLVFVFEWKGAVRSNRRGCQLTQLLEGKVVVYGQAMTCLSLSNSWVTQSIPLFTLGSPFLAHLCVITFRMSYTATSKDLGNTAVDTGDWYMAFWMCYWCHRIFNYGNRFLLNLETHAFSHREILLDIHFMCLGNKKILLSVPCQRFVACKWSLNGVEKV